MPLFNPGVRHLILKTQEFISAGTWNTDTSLAITSAKIFMIGGGAGGGGCATPTAAQFTAGGGGGAGGLLEREIEVTQTAIITIGAGGNGGATGANSGSPGS